MSMNEDKNYNSVNDTDGAYHIAPVQTTRTGNAVKARRAMGMTLLTARFAEKGMMYNVTVDNRGVITYTPLAAIPMEDITNNNINLCKAFGCSNNAVAVNAGGVARVGEYYFPSVDAKGIITYTPLRVALERLEEELN